MELGFLGFQTWGPFGDMELTSIFFTEGRVPPLLRPARKIPVGGVAVGGIGEVTLKFP